jgi:predicted nucleic acid-binding protein
VANPKAARRRTQSATGKPSWRQRRGNSADLRRVERTRGRALEHDAGVIKRLPAGTRRVTSALTLSEAGRAIIRARTTGRLTAQSEKAAVRALRTFERRCFVLEVNQAVLDRVRRSFPAEPIRTLDAIHLATAELLGEPPQLVTIVTRDERVRANALAGTPSNNRREWASRASFDGLRDAFASVLTFVGLLELPDHPDSEGAKGAGQGDHQNRRAD